MPALLNFIAELFAEEVRLFKLRIQKNCVTANKHAPTIENNSNKTADNKTARRVRRQ
jgi:hypothetical protein